MVKGKNGNGRLGYRKIRCYFASRFFSYRPIFCCRVFRLPNFPLPIFAVAVFSVAVISDIKLLPLFPTLLFYVAEFSRCPIFRCRFFRTTFYRCRFCRKSRQYLVAEGVLELCHAVSPKPFSACSVI